MSPRSNEPLVSRAASRLAAAVAANAKPFAVVAAIGLTIFFLPGSGNAGSDPVAKCKDAKAKAAGKKAASLMKAFGKNIAKNPDTKLTANVSKAQSKLTKSFTKAESSGSCATVGDAAVIEAKIDALVFNVIETLDETGFCGNDIRHPSEVCDGTDDEACPGACLPSCSCDLCGNDIALPPEECDGTDAAACGGATCLGDCTCNPCGNDIVEGSEECDGSDDAACVGLCLGNCVCPEAVCGNGVHEIDDEECDPPGVQGACALGEVCNGFCECEASLPCDCGTATPTVFSYTNKPPSAPICGTTDGPKHPDLECGALYLGGGGGALPVPGTLPDEAEMQLTVDFCNGTNLGLSARLQAETGSARNCTEGEKCSTSGTDCRQDSDCPATETCEERCLFGAPLAILDRGLPVLSSCIINTFLTDAVGGADCASGRISISLPYKSRAFLPLADQSPTLAGWQPCPVCLGGTLNVPGSGTCEGGANGRHCSVTTNQPCAADSDCPASETCNLGAACEPMSTPHDAGCCIGGTMNLARCSDDSECDSGDCDLTCSIYPTSHDCPPDPDAEIGPLPVPFALTTGLSERTANAAGSFCGFCRDENPGPGADPGSRCFEGDPDIGQAAGCPDSSSVNCQPASLGNVTECGAAVPCESDSDCAPPYETCEQLNPGAFRDPAATVISMSGLEVGDLSDYAGDHAGTLVSAFCIEPTFVPIIDASADIAGPGAVSLPGEAQLLSPSGAYLETSQLLD